jgi:hypothetical protein
VGSIFSSGGSVFRSSSAFKGRGRVLAADVEGRLGEVEDEIKDRIQAVADQKSAELLSRTQAKAAVHNRSGKMARSFKRKVYRKGHFVGAVVFSHYYIARFYENGFGGKRVGVRAHSHQGHAVKASFREVPKHVGERFLQSSFEEMRGGIRDAISEALADPVVIG